MANPIRDVAGEVSATLRKSLGQVLILHLAYVALSVIVFGPLTGLMARLLLRISGKTVVADTDILLFVLTPMGMASLILFGALLVTILAFEQSSIITICAGNSLGADIAPIQVLYHTALRARTFFSFSIRLIGRLLVIMLPFLAGGGAIAWLTLTDHDINYYLSIKPPIFFVSAILIGLLLLVMVLILIRKLIDWSLSLPLIMFADTSPAGSFARSEQLVSGNRLTLLTAFGIWALIALVLGSLIIGTIHFLGSQLIGFFHDSLSFMVLLLGGLAAIFTVGNLLVTAITAGGFGALLVALYAQINGEIPQKLFDPLRKAENVRAKAPGLTIVLVCGTLISVGVGIWLLQGIQVRDDIEVIAHRGAAGKAPENTMAAVRQALSDGADWVEIDVQETRDGHIVVVHDSDFMKLSNNSLKVWETTIEELKGIDVGSWFGPEFADERVPTLQDVLEESRGKARVLIELKYYGHDQQLEQRVIDIVERTGMVEDVAIMSLKYKGIQKTRSLRPDWKIGLLSATAIGNLSVLDADFLAVNAGMATPAFIKSSQSAGKKVLVWTINDRMAMSRMMSLGIDGIITDEPALARSVIAERSEMSTVERLLLRTAIILDQPLPEKTYRDQSP